MAGEETLASGCDCHVHVVAPVHEFPQSAARSYTAAPAPLDRLKGLAAAEGISRFVVVQPSFYGTDNSCMLTALDRLGASGRGVAALDLNGATPSLLETYHRRGVRGLRVNLYSKSLQFAPERICDRVQAAIETLPAKNWHVEIIAPAGSLAKAAKVIADSPAPIVLDHYALPEEAWQKNGDARQLLDLVSLAHVWVKLSAPYRLAELVMDNPLATTPPGPWLAALLQAAPDRCVWGSDWPHTPLDRDQKGRDEPAAYRRISYTRLVRDFVAALPQRAAASQILVKNPARLYGFQAK